ncbi:MAG: DUF1206 domain-containing protein [Sphingomonadaceae bacterium]
MAIDKSEKFTWLVRVGYFSRALLYGVLGLLALTSAQKIANGTSGVFKAIEDYPAGNVLLWIMVVGLAAYALFRFSSFAFDIENNGSDAKGWMQRIGHGGSAIGHLVFAYIAYQLASSHGHVQAGGGARKAASGLLSAEFGGVILGLLGIAFIATAFFQAKKGISGEFMNRIAGSAPSGTRWLGLAGYCARAVVYGVVGWSLFKAGFLSGGADQVKTLGAAVESLAGNGIIFKLTAIGLLLFGAFSLILSRYRIIPDLDESRLKPAFRS